MMNTKLPALLFLFLPMMGHADPLFGTSLAGGAKLPKAFGIGIDYFGMDQPYRIDSLVLAAPPGIPLPPEIRRLQIDYDGDVYGGGIVAVVGGDRWFASLTGTYTDTNLKGDYRSSVESVVLQPRVGIRLRGTTEVWIGGYWLDAEESHSGSLDLDFGFGPVPVSFAADLSQDEDFNFAFGMHTMFSDSWEATLEVGGGDRDTLLANLTYRFE